MIDGSAIITSRSGSPMVTDSSDQQIAADIHDVFLPSGSKLTTEEDGQIFFTLSNGVALAMDEQTSVKFLEYTQRVFDQEDQSRGPEPSISKLDLEFSEGQFAIASNRLSPLSEVRIRLPKGEVRLHKGTCLIRLDSTGLHLTAFEGSLTFFYPDDNGREFIPAPERIRISEQSMERQQIAETFPLESLDAESKLLCQAAQHASQRVTFKPNATSNRPPVPVLIVEPAYFQQTPLRPYQFKE